MISAADQQFIAEFDQHMRPIFGITPETPDGPGRIWTEYEHTWLLHFKSRKSPKSDISRSLNRPREEIDFELARLGHIKIKEGVTASLVMEKYGFSAIAYHIICNKLGYPSALHIRPKSATENDAGTVNTQDMKSVVRRAMIVAARKLAEESTASHKNPQSAFSRPVDVINNELAILLEFLGEQ